MFVKDVQKKDSQNAVFSGGVHKYIEDKFVVMTEDEYKENVLLENKIPYENFSRSLERNNYTKSFHTAEEDEVVEIFYRNILTFNQITLL